MPAHFSRGLWIELSQKLAFGGRRFLLAGNAHRAERSNSAPKWCNPSPSAPAIQSSGLTPISLTDESGLRQEMKYASGRSLLNFSPALRFGWKVLQDWRLHYSLCRIGSLGFGSYPGGVLRWLGYGVLRTSVAPEADLTFVQMPAGQTGTGPSGEPAVAKSRLAGMRRRALLLTLALAGANPLSGQDVPQKSALAQLSGAVRELTDRVSPAVVEVVVNGFGATDDGGRVANQISRRQSSGSGVVVNSSGYIITNAHVVQGAINLKVLAQSPRPPGAEPRRIFCPLPVDARVLGIDRESDLALLKIEAENLPVLPFGDSDKLRQGDLVLAIGSPLGLRNSVSMGVVSATGRAISDDNPILYIQTDASINPGNSGGALVDHDEFLVGVNSFIVTQSGGNEGIGFAIPSSVVRNVYLQLKQKGRVSRGSVRAFVQNITPVLAKGLGLPVQRGVVVADVEPDGPAERAGLKRKDIILSLNGNLVDTARRFDADINRRQGGEKLDLLVQRADDRLAIEVVVEEQSAPWDPLADMVSPEKNLIPRLGILCIEIDQRVQQMLPDLRALYGLIVAAKSPDGQAQFIDLQPGDVIHAVNNLPVAFLAGFQKTIDEFTRGDAVVLQIERDGRFQFVAFEIE
jgi:serine protease Do